jgi:integrase
MNKNTAPRTLSQRKINRIQPGQWLSENLGYGHGSLQVRGTTTGGRYYLRIGGGSARIPLGVAKGQGRLTLDEARQRAWEASAAGRHGPAHPKTLGGLLSAYCETLSQESKSSHPSTRALLHRHVRDPHPQLWEQRVGTISAQQIVSVLDPLVAEQKLGTAAKLRFSLSAAFNRALRADLCAQSPLMRGFNLTHNPVMLIAPISPGRQTTGRVLTISELRQLWKTLEGLRTPAGAILRFYMLTGGQWIAQLLRTRREDLVDGGVMLYDRKGRRAVPRPHLVPIIDPARRALEEIPDGGPYLLKLSSGAAAPHHTTLYRHLQSVAEGLENEGVARGGINFAAIRRTIETQLAAAAVPAIVRAHLQSHGLDGIQARHYDRYSYLEEKQAALKALYRLITKT